MTKPDASESNSCDFSIHKPVMARETIKFMDIDPDGCYIDGTGGGGGHSSILAGMLSVKGRLYILDRDISAVGNLKLRFKDMPNVKVIHSNFRDFDKALEEEGIHRVNGILADFGVSTMQLMEGDRGFSFRKDGPLDMRMNKDDRMSAADVVNGLSRETLSNIITKFGEEKFAWKIAGAIERRRAIKKFETTLDLAEVIASAVPAKFVKPGFHPATKTFQAIRIYVNGELEAIEVLLSKLEKWIISGGRAAFISFHSLEDRLVKEYFRKFASECVCPPGMPICNCGKKATFRIITRKPVLASPVEVEGNPLSRSAKLRVAERI